MLTNLYPIIIISIQFLCIYSESDECVNPSNISGMAFIDSMRMRWALTKSGYYWLLIENELPTSDRGMQLPHFPTVDAIAVKETYLCKDIDDDEFSIIFVQLIDQKLQYFTYDIDSGNRSNPKDLKEDVIFGNANIDYTKRLDAMFNGVSGQIFFIQGDLYSDVVLLANQTCPKSKASVTSHKSRSLEDLPVKSGIDASFYIEKDSKLYLLQKDLVFEIKVDTNLLMNGILKSISFKQIDVKHFFESNITFGCKSFLESAQFPATDNIEYDTTTVHILSRLDESSDITAIIWATIICSLSVIIWSAVICWAFYRRHQMERNYTQLCDSVLKNK